MSLVWYIKFASMLRTFIPTRSQWDPTSYQDYPAQALLYWLHYYDKIPGFTALWLPLLGVPVDRMLSAVTQNNQCSVFISSELKPTLIMSIFSADYQPQAEKEAIGDTNRLWCSKLSLILALFPEAKVMFCITNIAWIMDCIELLIRGNALDVSRLFNPPAERANNFTARFI